MTQTIIKAFSSEAAESAVKLLLRGNFIVEKARVSYNVKKGLPLPEETEKYPLILEGKVGTYCMAVHVYSVTAGYHGSGPSALSNILTLSGFIFDELDIFTKKHVDSNGQINLIYTR